METVNSTKKQIYLDKFMKGYLLTNISDHDASNLTAPSYTELIREEIEKQLKPIRQTHNAIIETTAQISIELDSLKKEILDASNINAENHQLKKKIKNINTILSFKELETNWNGNNAPSFSEKIIRRALDFINLTSLKYQPSVFPTAEESIQLEYNKSNGNYLEIEIFEDNYSLYLDVNDDKNEFTTNSKDEILKKINDFHSRF